MTRLGNLRRTFPVWHSRNMRIIPMRVLVMLWRKKDGEIGRMGECKQSQRWNISKNSKTLLSLLHINYITNAVVENFISECTMLAKASLLYYGSWGCWGGLYRPSLLLKHWMNSPHRWLTGEWWNSFTSDSPVFHPYFHQLCWLIWTEVSPVKR